MAIPIGPWDRFMWYRATDRRMTWLLFYTLTFWKQSLILLDQSSGIIQIDHLWIMQGNVIPDIN